MAAKRQWRNDTYPGTVSTYEKLDVVIDELEKALSDPNWKDLSLETEDNYGSCSIIIVGKRLETEFEAEYRAEAQRGYEERQAKQEREEFERLKKKFEGQNQ
jgi:hypothetical protein